MRRWLDDKALGLLHTNHQRPGVFVQYADSPVVAKWALPQCDCVTYSITAWWSGLWWYLAWWRVMRYPARLAVRTGIWVVKPGHQYASGHLRWPNMWARMKR